MPAGQRKVLLPWLTTNRYQIMALHYSTPGSRSVARRAHIGKHSPYVVERIP